MMYALGDMVRSCNPSHYPLMLSMANTVCTVGVGMQMQDALFLGTLHHFACALAVICSSVYGTQLVVVAAEVVVLSVGVDLQRQDALLLGT